MTKNLKNKRKKIIFKDVNPKKNVELRDLKKINKNKNIIKQKVTDNSKLNTLSFLYDLLNLFFNFYYHFFKSNRKISKKNRVKYKIDWLSP